MNVLFIEFANQDALTSSSSNDKITAQKPKIVLTSKSTTSSSNTKTFFDNFDADFLRIRSKEYRYAASFNSTLFFVIFFIFIAVFLCHYRYSSRHFSLLTFLTIMTCNLASFCRRSRRKAREISGQKLKLTNLFSDRDKKFEREGFSRLPTNETDFVDRDDDDDDEDILEDFHRTIKSSSKSPLV